MTFAQELNMNFLKKDDLHEMMKITCYFHTCIVELHEWKPSICIYTRCILYTYKGGVIMMFNDGFFVLSPTVIKTIIIIMFIYWFSIFTLCLSLFMEIQEQINNSSGKTQKEFDKVVCM